MTADCRTVTRRGFVIQHNATGISLGRQPSRQRSSLMPNINGGKSINSSGISAKDPDTIAF